MMGWCDGGGWGGGGSLLWLLMGLFWLALLALIAFLVIRLLPRSDGTATGQEPRPGPAQVNESPEQILDRMFALGEIDEETYRTRRTALAEMRRPS